MLKAGGYASITEGDGRISRESDTFTCAHKNCVVRVPPGFDAVKEKGAMCRACCRLICLACAEEMDQTLRCYPLEARLEDLEKNGRNTRRGGRWGTPIF